MSVHGAKKGESNAMRGVYPLHIGHATKCLGGRDTDPRQHAVRVGATMPSEAALARIGTDGSAE